PRPGPARTPRGRGRMDGRMDGHAKGAAAGRPCTAPVPPSAAAVVDLHVIGARFLEDRLDPVDLVLITAAGTEDPALFDRFLVTAAALFRQAPVDQPPGQAAGHRPRQGRGDRPRGQQGPDPGDRQGTGRGQQTGAGPDAGAPPGAVAGLVHPGAALVLAALAAALIVAGDDRDVAPVHAGLLKPVGCTLRALTVVEGTQYEFRHC